MCTCFIVRMNPMQLRPSQDPVVGPATRQRSSWNDFGFGFDSASDVVASLHPGYILTLNADLVTCVHAWEIGKR